MAIFRVPVAITGPSPGMPGVNVWHCRVDDAFDTDATLDLAIQELVDFYTAIAPLLAPAHAWQVGADITDVDARRDRSRPLRSVSSTATGVAGRMPPANQIVVGWKTDLKARRGMGRTFVGPLSAGQEEGGGVPTAPAVAALRTAAGALVDASQAANSWAFGVYGQEKALSQPGAINPETGEPFRVLRDFIGYKVNEKFAVLRSRRD
jgi:hypothetical protein